MRALAYLYQKPLQIAGSGMLDEINRIRVANIRESI
jgi:hypothetical protein